VAVTDPRTLVGVGAIPPTVTLPRPTGRTAQAPLVGKRMRLFGVLMTLPLLYLLVSYGRVEGGMPLQPGSAVSNTSRGRVLASDGTVLAGSIPRPDAMPWDTTPRNYPMSTLAGQVVGFGNNDGGLDGVEHFMNERLAAGKDVRLTIDPAFQAAAEAGLERLIKEKEGRSGSVVAVETGTGRILAVATGRSTTPVPAATRPSTTSSSRDRPSRLSWRAP
jgi:cell division protein FtsI (penicillin-binding protein 3)